MNYKDKIKNVTTISLVKNNNQLPSNITNDCSFLSYVSKSGISLISSIADLTQCTSPHFQKTLCNIADTS